MNTLYCGQKGCEFEIEDDGATPENCPVCGNPFIEHPNPDALHAVAKTEDTEDAENTETDTENESGETPKPKKSKSKFKRKH